MKILRVDLTTGKFADQEIPKDDLVKFLGGRGLAAKILYEENKPKIDAIDPENRLIIMTGHYTGTFGSFTGFYNVTTQSPLTGAIHRLTQEDTGRRCSERQDMKGKMFNGEENLYKNTPWKQRIWML